MVPTSQTSQHVCASPVVFHGCLFGFVLECQHQPGTLRKKGRLSLPAQVLPRGWGPSGTTSALRPRNPRVHLRADQCRNPTNHQWSNFCTPDSSLMKFGDVNLWQNTCLIQPCGCNLLLWGCCKIRRPHLIYKTCNLFVELSCRVQEYSLGSAFISTPTSNIGFKCILVQKFDRD